MRVSARKTEGNVWPGHMQRKSFSGLYCNVGVFSDLFQEKKTPKPHKKNQRISASNVKFKKEDKLNEVLRQL